MLDPLLLGFVSGVFQPKSLVPLSASVLAYGLNDILDSRGRVIIMNHCADTTIMAVFINGRAQVLCHPSVV